MFSHIEKLTHTHSNTHREIQTHTHASRRTYKTYTHTATQLQKTTCTALGAYCPAGWHVMEIVIDNAHDHRACFFGLLNHEMPEFHKHAHGGARQYVACGHGDLIFRRWSRVYGVATISRLFKIISLFCKRALLKRQHSAKKTYNLKEPTNWSHPIPRSSSIVRTDGGGALEMLFI